MVAERLPEGHDEMVQRLARLARRARLRLLPPPEPSPPPDREALRRRILELQRPHPPTPPRDGRYRGPGTFSRFRPENRDLLRAIFYDRPD